MAVCKYCGSTILFGGVRLGADRFCNNDCKERLHIRNHVEELPEDALANHIAESDRGNRERRIRGILYGANTLLGPVVAIHFLKDTVPIWGCFVIGGMIGGLLACAYAEAIIYLLRWSRRRANKSA